MRGGTREEHRGGDVGEGHPGQGQSGGLQLQPAGSGEKQGACISRDPTLHSHLTIIATCFGASELKLVMVSAPDLSWVASLLTKGKVAATCQPSWLRWAPSLPSAAQAARRIPQLTEGEDPMVTKGRSRPAPRHPQPQFLPQPGGGKRGSLCTQAEGHIWAGHFKIGLYGTCFLLTSFRTPHEIKSHHARLHILAPRALGVPV